MGIRSKISGPDFAAAGRAGYPRGGFGVVAARQPERLIPSPEQFSSNQQIADFIKGKFPLSGKFGKICGCAPCEFSQYKLRRDNCRCRWCKQTTLATRWAIVIVRYLNMGQPDTMIELEYNWKAGSVGSIAQKIRRAVAGLRQDGVRRTGNRRGRPKKIVSGLEIPDNQQVSLLAVYKTESTQLPNSC